MQIDFHHATTYVIARDAGLDHHDADIIAYAAQYVDDATCSGAAYFDNCAPATASVPRTRWWISVKPASPTSSKKSLGGLLSSILEGIIPPLGHGRAQGFPNMPFLQ